jgi:ubiquitin-conjugating enzyme E2 J1
VLTGDYRLRTFMETDAKGQLGGLECSDAMRRRMAKESQAWKCSSCGKSNGAILSECVEAANALAPAQEEVVPAELTMAWKDEMGATKKADSEDGESAELAEGFVQTAPVIEDPPPTPAAPIYPAARPAQSVPRPTAFVSLPAQHAPQTAQVRRNTNDGIPVWLDKAILGVSACLLVMILRVLFWL